MRLIIFSLLYSFTTKKGFRFCADPEDEWVQMIIKQRQVEVQVEAENPPCPTHIITPAAETPEANPTVLPPSLSRTDLVSTNKPVSIGTISIKATSLPSQQGYTDDPAKYRPCVYPLVYQLNTTATASVNGTDTPAPTAVSANINQPVFTIKPVSTVSQNIERE
ncbi:uncharacterized protein Hap1MRO34_012847 [Clarias gariepinus]